MFATIISVLISNELNEQFLIQIKKTKIVVLKFLLHFFHVCTLKSWLKLEIVKSCQKQNKVSTRINGDKNWEKIWISWWWSQDETSDCQKNCSHHRQLYLKDNRTPYTTQVQYEYRVIRKCCILMQIPDKKNMKSNSNFSRLSIWYFNAHNLLHF